MSDKQLLADVTIKYGTAAAIATINPVLLKAQPCIELDTGKIKIGDGVKTWSLLAYVNVLPTELDALSLATMKISTYDSDADGKVDGAEEADVAVKLKTARKINGVNFDGTTDITIADATKIPTSARGAVNGVASLGADGLVPSTQLPSYVDDVIEAASLAALNALSSKETGKIYVAIDTGLTYRWSGSTFISISNPLDIATQTEAAAGTNDTKAMTPLKTKQAIAAQVTIPTSLPPNGTAGGDLTGTYPNPTIGVGKVSTAKIADANVTTDKIANLAVTEGKIAASAVTAGKIGALAVTAAKIADSAVTNVKISDVDVQKLYIASGDRLIINGGEITV